MDLKYDYNDAYFYLKRKYNDRKTIRKENGEIVYANAITEYDDKKLCLLMGQYYYGIQAKIDLNNLLIQILG